MQTVVIVVHLMVVLAMIGFVLLQRSEGGGLGMGSGSGFLTSRGTSNVLSRTTAILAGVFFVTSLLLSILAGWERKPTSILQNTGAPAGQSEQPAPAGQGGRGVLDTLRGGGAPAQQPQGQPAPPAAQPGGNQGPQVPQSQ
ncbi:MAG TPA: preprotein translocase subunit SecG [Xanthobacteraceae bacterium]|jgi:preprotein translocase subunit SecG|nr:preprotein translocase subunit SecG [Xanthobacteraceae bacterium]